MRRTAFMLACLALPLASPTFAATAQPNLKACNAAADRSGITGPARTGPVEKCVEKSKTPKHKAKKHPKTM